VPLKLEMHRLKLKQIKELLLLLLKTLKFNKQKNIRKKLRNNQNHKIDFLMNNIYQEELLESYLILTLKLKIGRLKIDGSVPIEL